MWINPFNNLLVLCLVARLLVAIITDLTVRKIPNSLIISGLIVSLVGQCFLTEGAGGLNWLAGVAVAFACFIPLYVLRGMAAGDVKLMMAVGGFVGYPFVFTTVAYSYLAGGAIAISYVLFRGRFKQLLQNLYSLMFDQFIKTSSGVDMYDGKVIKQSVGQLPFAMAIAIGTLIALYLNTSGSDLILNVKK